MKHEISIRVTIIDPVPGVFMAIQKGKDGLVPPVSVTDEAVTFNFKIEVDLREQQPNFLGRFAQGPRDARFIYVNSGTYAGDLTSCWGRRAKISLMTITRELVDRALAEGKTLEAAIWGKSRDGGPMCASVPVVGGWKIS